MATKIGGFRFQEGESFETGKQNKLVTAIDGEFTEHRKDIDTVLTRTEIKDLGNIGSSTDASGIANGSFVQYVDADGVEQIGIAFNGQIKQLG